MAFALSAEGVIGVNQPLLAPGGIGQAAIKSQLSEHMPLYGICNQTGVALIQLEGFLF